ncbi:MAG TPA: TonB-dependent receptor [Burkholderiales bacterium]|nr:TonB-dependent receptor [Burkholderiales bacterium]
MKSHETAATLALALLPLSAHTQDATGVTEPVVVTATRTPQSLETTIRPVDIVSAEQIRDSGQQTLTELLQSRSNVQVASTGGFGQPASVFIRGANANHTLVLLDGIRVNDPLSSLTSFENLRGNQFSRIELVPGPLSSLYGSEAVGGVVQLFTYRWPLAPRVQGSIGYGTYDTTEVYGGVSAGRDNTGISVNAGYLQSGGFSATNASEPFGAFNPDRDPHRNRNLSASLVHRLAPDQEIGASAFYTDGSTHFDASPTTDDINRQRIGVFSAYTRNKLSDRWTSLLRMGVAQDQLSTQGFFPGRIASRQTQLTWQNDFATDVGTFIGGAEYLRQQARGKNDFAVDQREIYSAFAGYTGEFDRHILQASLRHDRNSQFGSETTGAAGYAYRLTEHVRLRASAGTAFHAPTFNDLYFPFFGNPDLQPEKSRSWEIGADLLSGRQRLGLTYFENRILDLIALQAPTFQPFNVSRARIRGLELSYQAELAGLEIEAHATLQDPRNVQTDKLLQRRARVFGNLALAKTIGRWRAGAELVGAGSRFDSNNENPASKLDAYAILNLLASYRFARDLSLDLRWNNVANTHYELVKGFNTPGSNVFVALRYLLPQ